MKLKLLIETVILLGAALAQPASATNTIFLYQNPFSFKNGGEVTAMTSPADFLDAYSPATILNGGFETFSVQAGSKFKPGVAYDFSLGNTDSHGRKLTEGAVFLYSEFASGTLDGFNYTDPVARLADAKELQAAIWNLQGRQTGGRHFPKGGAGNPYYNLAVTDLGLKNIRTANRGMFDVEILRLRGGGNKAHENQLVAGVNGSVVVVPEPGSASLGLLALGCVLAYSRRANGRVLIK